ncbi:hypothetical protein COU75_01930 [Candidatus Peregrinibacteria bacterium CG10_big_fil_rev_8_21_14_0_10_42_8]|nr:MAG: hypothetical protein COU75_01930 [Candidatus Peregrinibacteria bacterium CG10_big_fil_rev_8_21_14_0_10_42_8]
MATAFESIGRMEEIHHDDEDLLGLLTTLEDATDIRIDEKDIMEGGDSQKIPADRQLELFYRAKEGDADAAEELITSLTNFIYFFNRKTGLYFSNDEALEIGYLGIAQAFDNFDINRKVLFSTHACNHIRWGILNEIRRRKRVIGHEKSSDTFLKWHPSGADHSQVVENAIDSEERMLKKRKLLGFLDMSAAKIILYRSGAMDGKKYTQEETAEKMGLSKQRVGQIEQVATDTIQTAIENNGVLPVSAIVNKIERDDQRIAAVLREMHGINKYRETHSVKEMMQRYSMSQSGITSLRAQAKSRLLLASGIIGPDHNLQKVINMIKDKGKNKNKTIRSLGEDVRKKIFTALSSTQNELHRDILAYRLGQHENGRIATQRETAEALGNTEANIQMGEMLAIPELCTHYLLQDSESTQAQKGYVTLLEILNTTKNAAIRKAALRILDSRHVGRIGEAIESLPVSRQRIIMRTLHPEEQYPDTLDRNEKRKIQYEQKVELLDIMETMADFMGIPQYENPTMQKISEYNMTRASIEAIAEDSEITEIKSIIEKIRKEHMATAVFLEMRLGIGREKKASYREIQEKTKLPLQTVHTMLSNTLHTLDKKLSYARKKDTKTTLP